MLGRRHVYHVSPFASTPHRSSPGYAHSPPSPWSYEGFRKPENEKSYTIKLERAFRDDRREFYRHQPTWELEALRRELPTSIPYRNQVRGHRALQGHPALTRLAEQHRMAVPWSLDTLEQHARS